MKKRFVLSLFAAFMIFGAATPVLAQATNIESGTAATPKIAIGFNPFGLIIFDIIASGEIGITPELSIKVDLEYSPNLAWASSISILALKGGARYYFSSLIPDCPEWLRGEAIKGLFAGGGLGFVSETWNYSYFGNTYVGSVFQIDAFLEVGTKYFFSDSLYVEGFLGYDIVFPATWKWTLNGVAYDWGAYSFSPSATFGGLRYGANIGFAF